MGLPLARAAKSRRVDSRGSPPFPDQAWGSRDGALVPGPFFLSEHGGGEKKSDFSSGHTDLQVCCILSIRGSPDKGVRELVAFFHPSLLSAHPTTTKIRVPISLYLDLIWLVETTIDNLGPESRLEEPLELAVMALVRGTGSSSAYAERKG
jgi:hypothetical protein